MDKSHSTSKSCYTDWLEKGLKVANSIYVYVVRGLANFVCHSGCELNIVSTTDLALSKCMSNQKKKNESENERSHTLLDGK